MRDPSRELFKALRRGPLAVVLYGNDDQREGLLQELECQTPSEAPPWRRTTDLHEALESDAPVSLMPPDEGATVAALDGRREVLLGRSQPLVLFLLRGGSGEARLRSTPGLVSWLHGSGLIDPEGLEVDAAKARAGFIAEHGATPEEWLQKWRRGELPDDGAHNVIAQDAAWLAER